MYKKSTNDAVINPRERERESFVRLCVCPRVRGAGRARARERNNINKTRAHDAKCSDEKRYTYAETDKGGETHQNECKKCTLTVNL